ncbi:hypothetical protein ACS0TY_003470 [Phlomoides rotata]
MATVETRSSMNRSVNTAVVENRLSDESIGEYHYLSQYCSLFLVSLAVIFRYQCHNRSKDSRLKMEELIFVYHDQKSLIFRANILDRTSEELVLVYLTKNRRSLGFCFSEGMNQVALDCVTPFALVNESARCTYRRKI